MASRARLEWNGDALIDRLAEAARVSIDETLDEADAVATSSHMWVNRTDQLEEEIVTEKAVIVGVRVVGRFGTTQRRGFYGLFHEEGTVHEYARPFLRPAGDATFPMLASKIERNLHG
jgi:hypothetical protein